MGGCMLSAIRFLKEIGKGNLVVVCRNLQLHHYRIAWINALRKESYVPRKTDPLEKYHKSKHRARVFDQSGTYFWLSSKKYADTVR